MKKFIYILVVLALFSCDKIRPVPSCMVKKVNQFSHKNSCLSIQVSEYKYLDSRYYVFYPGNCGADMLINYYNDACENIGYSGGITGKTFIYDSTFLQAEFVRVIFRRK